MTINNLKINETIEKIKSYCNDLNEDSWIKIFDRYVEYVCGKETDEELISRFIKKVISAYETDDVVMENKTNDFFSMLDDEIRTDNHLLYDDNMEKNDEFCDVDIGNDKFSDDEDNSQPPKSPIKNKKISQLHPEDRVRLDNIMKLFGELRRRNKNIKKSLLEMCTEGENINSAKDKLIKDLKFHIAKIQENHDNINEILEKNCPNKYLFFAACIVFSASVFIIVIYLMMRINWMQISFLADSAYY
jgi:hypothetical protein